MRNYHALKYGKLSRPEIWEIIMPWNIGNYHALKYMFHYQINLIRPRTPCLGDLAWEILPGPMGPGPWAPAEGRAAGKFIKET